MILYDLQIIHLLPYCICASIKWCTIPILDGDTHHHVFCSNL